MSTAWWTAPPACSCRKTAWCCRLFPQDFVVDDHPGHRDPRKMLASRLEINVHLVTASVQEHNSLVGAVNQAHLPVEETVFEALAACYAAVLPEDRREGIAVVDIGAQSTELVVYYGDAMQLASTVRICGDHFTRDLAQGLCLSFEDAELVKLEYGCAVPETCPENVLVELPTPENREPRHAPRQFVNQILEARAEELFQIRARRTGARRHGPRADRRRLPDRRRRASAGSVRCRRARAAMPGALRLAVGIRGLAGRMNDPEWTTAAGLAMYSAKLKMQAAMPAANAPAGWARC